MVAAGRGSRDRDAPAPTRIRCTLGALLDDRDMSLAELSRRVGVSVTNLSLLKNDHVRAVRYSTLEAVCEVLECQPGDLLRYEGGARR